MISTFLQIPVGGFTLPGALGQNPGASTLEIVITTAIGVITIVAFIWFTIQFLVAAVQIIGSGGDKNALAQSKSKLTTSLIGLVVVISAIFLIQIIGVIFGISILNIAELIAGLPTGN